MEPSRRGCEEGRVFARYLGEFFALLSKTAPGGTKEGGDALKKSVGWVYDALTDMYVANECEDLAEASFGRHCTVFVMSRLKELLAFVTQALGVCVTRDAETRGSWDEALCAVLGFLNDFRDANKDGVRKFGWPRWLAQTFVEHHDKVGAKTYRGLVLCMTNVYDGDEPALRSVKVLKHDLLQGLRKNPHGALEVRRDVENLCDVLGQDR